MSGSNRERSAPDRLPLADSVDPAGPPWSAFLAGDCIVRESYREAPFGPELTDRMRSATVSIANLEAPVAESGSPATKSGPINQTVRETPAILTDAGIDAVTLANNHSMDYGVEGLSATLEACAAADLETCGAGMNDETALAPLHLSVAEDAVEVGLMSICEREFGVAEGSDPGVAWVNHPQAMAQVRTAAAETDVLILCVHGGIEYTPIPPDVVRERARAFVEAGADVIIGHHPHVPQGWEVVDGVPVFYSLGNFLFFQSHRPNTQHGLGLEIEFRGSDPVGIELVPTAQADGGVEEMTETPRRAEFLGYLHRLADLTADEPTHQAHWQEVADRVFLQRHAPMLRRSGGGDLIGFLRHPVAHLRKGGLWDDENRQHEMLSLLNIVRNESHRAVIETALELRTGERPDRRTPQVELRVRSLFDRTEDRQIYDLPSTPERGLSKLLERLSSRIDVNRTPRHN